MRNLLIILVGSLLFNCRFANSNNDPVQQGNGGGLLINISNHYNTSVDRDSVFVVPDRYDLSGAGVVRRVVYPNAKQVTLYR